MLVRLARNAGSDLPCDVISETTARAHTFRITVSLYLTSAHLCRVSHLVDRSPYQFYERAAVGFAQTQFHYGYYDQD